MQLSKGRSLFFRRATMHDIDDPTPPHTSCVTPFWRNNRDVTHTRTAGGSRTASWSTWRSTGRASLPGRGSSCAWPGRCCGRRGCCCWTRRRLRWTTRQTTSYSPRSGKGEVSRCRVQAGPRFSVSTCAGLERRTILRTILSLTRDRKKSASRCTVHGCMSQATRGWVSSAQAYVTTRVLCSSLTVGDLLLLLVRSSFFGQLSSFLSFSFSFYFS